MASSHAKLPRLFRSALPPIAQNQLILGFLKDSSKGGSGRSHFAFLGTYLREKRALCVWGGDRPRCAGPINTGHSRHHGPFDVIPLQ